MSGMARLPVLTLQGKQASEVEAPDRVFGMPMNSRLIHEAVVAYRAGGRAGTHATKNRTEVRGGGGKPWRQKKTGRSRHGSTRSPLWKGGGTVFGPQPRSYAQRFPIKKRRGALRSALSAKLRDGKLIVVESLVLPDPKTKTLLNAMSDLGVAESVLLVDEPVSENLALSARNLPKVKTTLGTALNVFDILKYESLVMTETAFNRVTEVLSP